MSYANLDQDFADILDNWQAAQHQDQLILQKRALDDLVALYYDAVRGAEEAHNTAKILERCRNIAAGLGLLKEFNQSIGR